MEQRVADRTEELALLNLGLSAEIIERKRLQDEVHRYNEELEQRVADRTRELSVLYDVTSVASNVLDLDELLSRLLGQSLLAIRRSAGMIYLVNESSSMLQLCTEKGVPHEISEGIVPLFAKHGEARALLEKHAAFIFLTWKAMSVYRRLCARAGGEPLSGCPSRIRAANCQEF